MLIDKAVVWRFNRGSRDALRSIYDRYKDDLLGLAFALLNDKSVAEDVVHDVFVSFARQAGRFELSGRLKGFLLTCTANAARDRNRGKGHSGGSVELLAEESSRLPGPDARAMAGEESEMLYGMLLQLPYEQREVIVLYLHHGMKFRQIAGVQGVSINTVQSRYRYGLDKLRSLLNGEVEL